VLWPPGSPIRKHLQPQDRVIGQAIKYVPSLREMSHCGDTTASLRTVTVTVHADYSLIYSTRGIDRSKTGLWLSRYFDTVQPIMFVYTDTTQNFWTLILAVR